MALRNLPDRDLVRQLLDYDPDTGVFTWRSRPREMFSRHKDFLGWNKRFSGTTAGASEKLGYRHIAINGTLYLVHRLAWLYIYSEPVPTRLDHIDGEPANNRIANLRAATNSENHANARRNKVNTTGIKGVDRAHGKYRARVQFHGVEYHLGLFPTLAEAATARREAAERLHGEFVNHG